MFKKPGQLQSACIRRLIISQMVIIIVSSGGPHNHSEHTHWKQNIAPQNASHHSYLIKMHFMQVRMFTRILHAWLWEMVSIETWCYVCGCDAVKESATYISQKQLCVFLRRKKNLFQMGEFWTFGRNDSIKTQDILMFFTCMQAQQHWHQGGWEVNLQRDRWEVRLGAQAPGDKALLRQ